MNPGETQFTRIAGAYSSAASIVSEMTPAFAAEYGPSNRVGRIPETGAWFTMQPPESRINGTAARMPWNVPARLTPTIFAHARSEYSWSGRAAPIPALLTNTQIPPTASVAATIAAVHASGSDTSATKLGPPTSVATAAAPSA